MQLDKQLEIQRWARTASPDLVAARVTLLVDALLGAENALDDYITQLERRGASLNYGRAVLKSIRYALARSGRTESATPDLAQRAAEAKAKSVAAMVASAKDADWPEDFAHDNGMYLCRCRGGCGVQFIGHKRRMTCRVCATKQNAPTA